MTDAIFPPGLVLILGAFALPFVSERVKQSLIILLPLVTLWLVQTVPDGVSLTTPFLHFQLELVEGNNLSRLFATIFALMALVGGLFALNQKSVVEMSAAFTYAGSAIGVAFAGDLITMFIFWELMAIGSSMVIWSAMTQSSYKSSMRYIMMHLFGGVILMIGVVAHAVNTGSIEFTAMELGSFGTWMMLIGFLINAGAPPFSSWLPDAYPEAS
ncbi:MAG: Na+/H+ antiporter subunit D, partial [Rhodospirillaceae bacterium]|nr:Na+/H+ antiporter subunit D [Rhodospirillaceae bacterium]